MNRNYYPLLKEYLSSKQVRKIFEADTAKPQRLEDMEDAISPVTGNKINVKKEKEEIERIKGKIVEQSALYRPFIHTMTPTIYTWLVPTMATDGVRLFVNPEFSASLDFLGKIFVIIHEIYHCILLHMQRGEGFDLNLFNMAADYEVNPLIVDTTDDFSEDFVKNKIHGLYEAKYLNVPVEEIYRDLQKNPPNTPPQPASAGDIKIDPTKMGQGNPSPSPPPGQKQPPQKAEIVMKPGVKVRIKATGKTGVITKVNSDGTFEVDPINEELIMPRLIKEGYRRDELVPILPKGANVNSAGSGSSAQIQGEYEIEDGGEKDKSGKGEGGKQGEKSNKKGQGSGAGASGEQEELKAKAKGMEGKSGTTAGEKTELSPEEAAAEMKRLRGKTQNADKGRAGGIIDTKTGEQIARSSGYDEDEIRAGEEGRAKWEENAREMLTQLEKIKQAGSGRGEAMINRLKKILKSSTDWKTMLKVFVGNAISDEKHWRLPAKKHMHKSEEYLKRGLKIKKDALKKVIICVDFSGSMFGGQIAAFDRCISEIQNIIYAKKIKEIQVIYFDDGVDPGSIQSVKKGQKIFRPKLGKGGGGTNFQAPLDWIHEHYKDNVNLCIFLTDGYASMPETPPYHRKFIWVVYDHPNFIQENHPFGRVIESTSADLGA
jgi:predicted metal-dependent peptidase